MVFFVGNERVGVVTCEDLKSNFTNLQIYPQLKRKRNAEVCTF